ncbi:acetyl/propionyl/methylcrotonyl-CoA carboxylase subunit alpha [Ferrithrix thermotolerans]|uniref:acetyl/propionyl/methylcrotonyl-CoA carboxylase subunit alpha n=1 Tax=Ferrithrix thermotolerans TaxID=209649 RepID=UPI000933F0FF|nr:biotin carboxylase N-terminal domain-containing protein [Ferrithrix thermotolerans]
MSSRSIKRVLVANRAEIASRIFRTAHELGIETVAIYSDPDYELPYVREATLALRIPGQYPRDTYLNIEAIMEAIERSGADAVHPGYGFLSENAKFASAIESAGVTFIGPSSDTIRTMGSKTEAKALMQDAYVPTLPQVVIDKDSEVDVETLSRLPYPLLVKAAYGGGGRGMRILTSPSEALSLIRAAQREALSSFGDPLVFVEPYIERPRHIEVQIFGDRFGDIAHLFERECSLQRRYQKIIEESPSPLLNQEQRTSLLETAVRAGKAVSYVGAGTVEFIFSPDGAFYFLEMNTRLQVEHPITEMVTGLDLVKEQFRIAQGEPLSKEIREAAQRGWAIEARIYAEDPLDNYTPQAGQLRDFSFDIDTVRVDSGFESNTSVSSFYDAMLAKVIAFADTREQAASKLELALRRAQIAGVPTNTSLIRAILKEEEFLRGDIDTAYLLRHTPATLIETLQLDTDDMNLYLSALVLYVSNKRSKRRTSLHEIPFAWRNVYNSDLSERVSVGDKEFLVSYGFRPKLAVKVDEREIRDPKIDCLDEHYVRFEGNGRLYNFWIHENGDGTYIVNGPAGSVNARISDRFPSTQRQEHRGSLLAPMPGTVVEVYVLANDKVLAGDPLLSLEAMKMQHVITAPNDGVVTEIRVKSGDQVGLKDLLVVLDESSND